jgi:two-component system chemotaxis response regulator CheY
MTTVLYVDDSHLGRTVARMSLSRAGYTVIEAPDGVAGLEAANSHTPDCLVVCISTPAIDGLTLIRRLRQSGNQARVIVIAAHPRRETLEACQKLGVASIIERPTAGFALADCVAAALGTKNRVAA